MHQVVNYFPFGKGTVLFEIENLKELIKREKTEDKCENTKKKII